MRVDSETTDNKYLNDIPRYLVPKLQLGNAYYQTTITGLMNILNYLKSTIAHKV
jgi:hypothetical protein